mmetsp:Transcript_34643/g.74772  ORF Transcript_34643/g.74772 Transcript_34643/m.74772 type:complete len:207 (+) Transcript_34643:960-1580(+)
MSLIILSTVCCNAVTLLLVSKVKLFTSSCTICSWAMLALSCFMEANSVLMLVTTSLVRERSCITFARPVSSPHRSSLSLLYLFSKFTSFTSRSVLKTLSILFCWPSRLSVSALSESPMSWTRPSSPTTRSTVRWAPWTYASMRSNSYRKTSRSCFMQLKESVAVACHCFLSESYFDNSALKFSMFATCCSTLPAVSNKSEMWLDFS